MLFVVRHGERCDTATDPHEKSRVSVISDPPLTHTGLLMADLTGNTIQHLLNGNGAPIRIITSPFARCVETAERIAMRLSGVGRVDVDYQCGEFLNSKWFEVDPLSELMVLNSPDFLENLPIPIHFLPSPRPVFPEVWSDMTSRYLSHISSLSSELLSHPSNLIIVTHGYYADIFCGQFGDHINYADFCALSYAVVEGQILKLVQAKSCDHVRGLYSARS